MKRPPSSRLIIFCGVALLVIIVAAAVLTSGFLNGPDPIIGRWGYTDEKNQTTRFTFNPDYSMTFEQSRNDGGSFVNHGEWKKVSDGKYLAENSDLFQFIGDLAVMDVTYIRQNNSITFPEHPGIEYSRL